MIGKKKVRVLVTMMPENPEECPFAEYNDISHCYRCMFKFRMNRLCNLSCHKECEYLAEDK